MVHSKKGGRANASILCEMPSQERDEGPKDHNHEEWKASNSGDMPHLRYENVQDWEGLGRHLNLSVRRKAGYQDRTENEHIIAY